MYVYKSMCIYIYIYIGALPGLLAPHPVFLGSCTGMLVVDYIAFAFSSHSHGAAHVVLQPNARNTLGLEKSIWKCTTSYAALACSLKLHVHEMIFAGRVWIKISTGACRWILVWKPTPFKKRNISIYIYIYINM